MQLPTPSASQTAAVSLTTETDRRQPVAVSPATATNEIPAISWCQLVGANALL